MEDGTRRWPPSRPLICLVTDRRALTDAAVGDDAAAVGQLLDLIADCAHAGVDLVQIREPGLPDRRLAGLVRDAVGRTRDTPTRIVVNDRPDVALAAGADGVHLKDDGRRAGRVRALGPPDWILGRSVHDASGARRAAAAGAVDYLLAGTVFPSCSKPGRPPLGTAALGDIVRAAARPVLAIGGVRVTDAGSVAAAGAAGVAGIRLFGFPASGDRRDRLAECVQRLRAAFDRAAALG